MAGPSKSNYDFVAVIPEIADATKPRVRELANTTVEIAKSPGFSPRLTGHNASTITMDEGVISTVEAEEFIRLGMIDGLTIKVSRCGGLLSAKRMIELVENEGLFWLASGLTDPAEKELVTTLDPTCRLLTLVGPGGCGKTRLALEAGAARLPDFADGVFFVSLAPLRSVESVVPTIAQVLGFSLHSGDDPAQQLLNYLKHFHQFFNIEFLILVLNQFKQHALDFHLII